MGYDTNITDYMDVYVRSHLGYVIPREISWTDFSEEAYIGTVDKTTSVVPVIEHLLNNTRIPVTVYYGLDDFICNERAAKTWIERMRWAGRGEFLGWPGEYMLPGVFLERGGRFSHITVQ